MEESCLKPKYVCQRKLVFPLRSIDVGVSSEIKAYVMCPSKWFCSSVSKLPFYAVMTAMAAIRPTSLPPFINCRTWCLIKICLSSSFYAQSMLPWPGQFMLAFITCALNLPSRALMPFMLLHGCANAGPTSGSCSETLHLQSLLDLRG